MPTFKSETQNEQFCKAMVFSMTNRRSLWHHNITHCDAALLCVRKGHGLFSSSVPPEEMDKQKSYQAQACSECNWQQQPPANTKHILLTTQHVGQRRYTLCHVTRFTSDCIEKPLTRSQGRDIYFGMLFSVFHLEFHALCRLVMMSIC